MGIWEVLIKVAQGIMKKEVICRESYKIGKKNPLPISSEVMVEGFLQIVSEARVSVKQFCRTLVNQIQELDEKATENLSLLLQPYNVHVTCNFSFLWFTSNVQWSFPH